MATELEQAVTVREPEPAMVPKESPNEVALEKYRGISQEAVSREQAGILMDSIDETDIEIRPDGMIYLPEIKYRRRLNQAFLPGGWALMPTSKFDMRDNTIMRQYALYVGGRFISEVVGEQEYIQNNPNMTYATAAEGCKSNALMRCCKDLGIASELWDPNFITAWIAKHAAKVWNPKTSKFNYRRNDRDPFFWEKKDQKKGTTEPEQTQGVAPPDQPQIPYAEQKSQFIPPESKAEPNGNLISDPQRKRMYAIARAHGMNDEQFKAELETMGYKSSKDVTKDAYQDICSHFES